MRPSRYFISSFFLVLLSISLAFLFLPRFFSNSYRTELDLSGGALFALGTAESDSASLIPRVKHISTPDPLKALYLTSWAAGTPSLREHVADLIRDTEANAVVIDVKDYTGRIAFAAENTFATNLGAFDERVPDLEDLLGVLHRDNIYTIARIAVFQDLHLARKRADLAVKRASDKSLLWKDRKGITWIDPGTEEVWEYVAGLGKEAYDLGFDEINFDYIRFPSDGNMNDIFYPASSAEISQGEGAKPEIMRRFFEYLHDYFAPLGIPISADLFGMTTTNSDDLRIGQILEYALPYFDYISPMVYPSHYPPSFLGFANPAAHPYEVVKFSMESAVERVRAASSSPLKLRPWLQDFDLGANYTAEMVRAQMHAVYDAGLTSWMLWDPTNKYTKEALAIE